MIGIRSLKWTTLSMLCLGLFLVMTVCAEDFSTQQRRLDAERADYWRTQGYNFNPSVMSAFQMDEQVKDIKRAEYWRAQGYNFNPSVMSAFQMDEQVKDIKRAEYWRAFGYDFNPNTMSAFQMDQEAAKSRSKLPRQVPVARPSAQVYVATATASAATQVSQPVSIPAPPPPVDRSGIVCQPEDIRLVKTFLYASGYDLDTDSTAWDADSRNAVRDFQQKAGLDADGVVGPKTLRAIAEAVRTLPGLDPTTRIGAYMCFREMSGSPVPIPPQPSTSSTTPISSPAPAPPQQPGQLQYPRRYLTPQLPPGPNGLMAGDDEEDEDEQNAFDSEYRPIPPIEDPLLSLEAREPMRLPSWNRRDEEEQADSDEHLPLGPRLGVTEVDDDSKRDSWRNRDQFTFENYSSSSGKSIHGTNNTIGDTTFHHMTTSDGESVSGSTSRIGDTEFHRFSDSNGNYMNGTSNRIGDTSFHRLSDSDGNYLRGTSNRIGDTEFHRFSDSNGNTIRGTTTRVGDFEFKRFTDSDGNSYSGSTYSPDDE